MSDIKCIDFKRIVLAIIISTYEQEISMAFSESMLLPSMGIVYQLPDFDGTVKVKPFTTKAYKDLLTGNASEQALTQFVETCLVDCPIKAKNMNQLDVLAILFKIRAMTLGNKLKTQVTCPRCNTVTTIDWDLNAVDVNYLQVEKYPIPIVLPSGKEIKLRFPTGADTIKAKAAAEKRASMFKKDPSEFTNLYTIVSLLDVDSMDIIEKADWYENISPKDAVYINEAFKQMDDVFGVKMTQDMQCASCDRYYTTHIDIWADFFRPDSSVSLGITSKAGNLSGIAKLPDISE